MTNRMLLVWLAAFTLLGLFPVGSVSAADKPNPSGTWTWVRGIEGESGRSVLKLVSKDGKLTGTYKRMGQEVPITKGKIDGRKISFETEGNWNGLKVHGNFAGTLSKEQDMIRGTIEVAIEGGTLPLDWIAKRGFDPADVVGTWNLKIEGPNGNTFEPTLKLSADGAKLKGTYKGRFGEHEIKDAKFDGSELTWKIDVERDGAKFKAAYKGKPDKNSIKGSLEYDFDGNTGSVAFSGQRAVEKKDAPKAEEKKQAEQKPAENKSSQVSTPKRRVIVQLKSRRELLIVYSGVRQGPAFSIVRLADGKTIAKEISLKDLQASYPQVFETYRTSFADLQADTPLRSRKSATGIQPSRKRLSNFRWAGE
jgi:hypothetical protein